MCAKTPPTIDDLYKVEGKVERVNGEIVEMPASGDEPNVAGGEIFAHLREYVRRAGRGMAYTDGIGFHVTLPHRESMQLSIGEVRWRKRNRPCWDGRCLSMVCMAERHLCLTRCGSTTPS